MTHIIAEPCIGTKDKACVDVCPVDCIYGADEENLSQLYIHPEECIDCSLCVDACPVEAIFHEDEVPDKWNVFIAVNYWYFGIQPPEF
ncbi:MAG: ferredoxin family protein [Spirulina sp. SIO3F2]|nr:ferredoxin family protein [Spirulina sp. SIO3F2]